MTTRTWDHELFLQLVGKGFTPLVGHGLLELTEYLRAQAIQTGMSAPMLVADATGAVLGLLEEHHEYGGVRTAFLGQLDAIAQRLLPGTRIDDPPRAAAAAAAFRTAVLECLSTYDPALAYDQSA